jgi:diaminohydroxyphosphoribosylaminopyrimidine deaminase/5-amino-6-(5-phosphoribosylamino)uracil reductase
MDHLKWMQQAYSEALLSVGTSRPNPAVGAILVRDGAVVGRGRTQKPGSHHAEVMALRDAGEFAAGASMYVTLEPCCYFGRTPPCADAIIAAKVTRVFVSVMDQNPKVNGGGIARLREAGIPVELGILGEFGADFYRGYHHHLHTGLPWVDVKIAQSLDGFIAGPRGERTQITCPETSLWVHRLRARVDAIAVGGGTVRHDDPQLTVRGVEGNNPFRIIVTRSAQMDSRHKILCDGEGPTLVYSQEPPDDLLSSPQVQMKQWPGSSFSEAWLAILKDLGAQGFHRVLFEAGATMAGLLLHDSRLWNRFYLLTAPKILGEGLGWKSQIIPNWKDSLHLSRFEVIGCDFLTEFENVHGNHTSSRTRPHT